MHFLSNWTHIACMRLACFSAYGVWDILLFKFSMCIRAFEYHVRARTSVQVKGQPRVLLLTFLV